MTPEGREKLKDIVGELIKYVDLPETFSDFISTSVAVYNGTNWSVYVDGENKSGEIIINGATEYEAKENAWAWFSSIINECKNRSL